MPQLQPTPLWLHDVLQHGTVLLSDEVRQLAHLHTAGLAVPVSYAIPGDLFLHYLKQSGLQEKIEQTVAKIDPNNTQQLAKASVQIRQAIANTPLSAKAIKMLDAAFAQFIKHLPAAITSPSYTVRPQFTNNLAGHQLDLPVHTVTTATALRNSIHTTYSSLFDTSLLHTWLAHGCDFPELAVSFLIQPLLPIQSSGTARFNGNQIEIRAIYGPAAPLLSRAIKGDLYQLDADSLEILGQDINRQTWRLEAGGKTTKHIAVPRIDQSLAKIQQAEIAAVGQLLNASRKFAQAKAIIWTLDTNGRIWLDRFPCEVKASAVVDEATPILAAKPVSPGIATGTVRHVHRRSDISQLTKGDIAIIELADWRQQSLPAVAGIIAEAGSERDSLSRLAKQQGIPMIIGASTAAHKLKAGLVVTVNGYTGTVSRGALTSSAAQTCHSCEHQPSTVTGTKIYAALTDLTATQDRADGVAVQGDQLYTAAHRDSSAKQLTDHLALQLSELQSTHAQPLIYEIGDDASSNLFGYRGAIRHLRQPEQFKIELEALRRFETTHHAHAYLVLPSVRTRAEYDGLVHLLNGSGLDLGNRTRLWLPCNVPATLFQLEEFLADGLIDGVLIDIHQLAQHTLGADMSHEQLAGEYDLHESAVMTALEHAAQLCREHSMPLAVRNLDEWSPEFIEALVALGVTSIIAPADETESLRQILASAEHRLILNHAVLELHAPDEIESTHHH